MNRLKLCHNLLIIYFYCDIGGGLGGWRTEYIHSMDIRMLNCYAYYAKLSVVNFIQHIVIISVFM